MVLSAIIAFLPCFIMVKRENRKFDAVLLYCTLAYLGMILLITIFRRDPGSRYGIVKTKLNFGAMESGFIQERQVLYCILNVFLFMPYGFFIALLRRSEPLLKALCMSALTCFVTSMFIEVVQLITGRGRFEVTDLVTNVIGGAAGAFLGLFLCFLVRKVKKK